ncbi:cupin domain-containing protein [Hymenobacter sp. RP-2-7]|uniref:Cupin domain-containing protein n=1 Tax=Hymenobacter polaris TaxID=2682546 RepID=A0A7Y0AC61_9BACT|nr:cupin domain-containing protein [Hymenobacter polaris]NML64641.1 cupin domain-containing protein [Hymenobacter polaris]
MHACYLAVVALAALALPADSLPSAVYHAPAAPGAATTQLLTGSTLDLAALEVTTATLAPGQASRPRPTGAEELLIVAQGQLTATLADTTRTLGAGGVLLAMAGTAPALRNASAAPARYWTLKFTAVAGADARRGQAGGGSRLLAWPGFRVIKTDKGETRPVFDRPSSMFPRFDVHATVLKAGLASHPPHTHRAEEIVLLTQGQGQIQINDQTYPAAAGDVILLRANVPHAFTNTSRAPVSYFAIQWHSQAGE